MSQTAAMSETTVRLVHATASRLRLAYESLSTAPTDTRTARLGEVVRDATNRVAPHERNAFLDALRDLFPTWDGTFRAAPAEGRTEPNFDTSKLTDPQFLVEQLLAIAPKLSEGQRKAVVETLASAYPVPKPQQAPLIPAPAPNVRAPEPLPPAVPIAEGEGLNALRQVMSIGQISLDANRVALTLALVWDLCCTIDDLAWHIWEIASSQSPTRSKIQRRASLKPTLTKIVTGDRGVAISNVDPAIRELRGLTAGLLTAVGDSSRYARDQCMKLDPDRIDSTVRAGMMMRSGALWEAYRKKFSEVSGTLTQSVNGEVIKSVEFYMAGR